MLWIDQLEKNFPQLKFHRNFFLSEIAFLKIGGSTELFCHIKDKLQFSNLIEFCFKKKICFRVIGDCSNTLISDDKITGLIIKNDVRSMVIVDDKTKQNKIITKKEKKLKPRWKADSQKGTFKYNFEDLKYDENCFATVCVKVSSGLPLPYLITNSIKNKITGLQWFAGIPGTVGGAIVNNIHGGTYFFNDFIKNVEVINTRGRKILLNQKELRSTYNSSRFHTSKEIIINATFNLFRGDAIKAKYVQNEWIKRKRIQAKNSLGSIFHNLSSDQQKKLKIPTNSVGFVIEHILQLQGKQIGKAQVSLTHAGFIENLGGATSSDYLELIRLIINTAKEKLSLKLIPEIFFLGFKQNELAGIL